jgi:hypothetical protein
VFPPWRARRSNPVIQKQAQTGCSVSLFHAMPGFLFGQYHPGRSQWHLCKILIHRNKNRAGYMLN